MKVHSVKDIIEEIIKLRYTDCKSTIAIVKHLKSRYDLNESRSYTLIRKARAEVGELYSKMSDNVLEDAIASLEEQLQTAKQNGDGALQLKVQQEINKVNSLYIQKVDITSKGDRITLNIISPDKNIED